MLSVFNDGRLFGEKTIAQHDASVTRTHAQVLGLHGWRKDHHDVKAVLDPFSSIALDLPGFGQSPMPTDVWGTEDFASAISCVLRENPSPMVIFGHSFGGRVALQLAARYPANVRALVLTGVPLLRNMSQSKKPPLLYRMARTLHRVGVLSDARMEKEKSKRGSADYRAASGVQRDIFVKVVNESYEQQLAQVTCPVFMVWGEHDTEAPLAQAQRALQLLTRASFTSMHVMPGGSHWSPLHDPAQIAILHETIRRALGEGPQDAHDDAMRNNATTSNTAAATPPGTLS